VTYPILTPLLTIEPLQQRDLAAFVEYRKDPEIARFQSWDTDYSNQQAVELIEGQIGVVFPDHNQWLQLAIRLQGNEKLVGDLAIHNLGDAKVEIGFTISKAFQRRGIAREAVAALIDVLEREFGTRELIATPDSRNTASIKLLESLGFSEKPELSWWEDFKGERVQVLHYALTIER
jgi:RimJ/RimL family protein N-acetyltransferase